jgi:UDP-glucose 4-epimerase
MRVLVTGGAGFIGSHIAEALRGEGHAVTALDNLSSGDRANLPADVRLCEVDIRNGERVRQVVKDIAPEVIFHEAAQMSVSLSVRNPLLDAEINACGLINVLTAAAELGTRRVIFASSGGVLYGEVTTPATEDHPADPQTPYGITKWMGERYLKFFADTHGMTCIALRYANVYGPRQNPHGEAGVVAIFVRKLFAGETPTINGDGGCVRDYIHASDVTAANLAAMRSTLTGFHAFNVGTAIGTDVNALAREVRAACLELVQSKSSSAALPEFTYGPERAGDLRSNLISHAKATAELDWQPAVTLKAGIRDTVQWFAARDAAAKI